MHARERRQLRVFIRRDTYGRYVSVLVYLPRDRYNTGVRERFGGSSQDSSAASTSSSPCGSTSPRPRACTSSSTCPRAASIPEVDVADLERRLTEASRSWRDDFIPAVVREYGEERGIAARPALGRLLPRGLQGGLPARAASVDLGRLEAIPGDEGIDLRSTSELDAGRAARRGSRSTGSAAAVALARCCRCSRRWASRSSTSARTSSRGSSGRRYVYEFGLRYGRDAARRLARAVPGRAARGVGRLQRDRRLQRAGARRRADLAAGDRAARLREVHAAGQHARSPRTTSRSALRGNVDITRLLVRAVRGAVRPRRERRWSRRRGAGGKVEAMEERIVRPSTTWPASTTTGSCGPT